ncbi:MAG: GNAT family N-acetyltransferase [Hydrogenophaga sp.]|nr:GNAT family N-acetyltransferase [Hydrogenophaga sp.]
MAADIFQTQAWFDNLRAHGFESPPQVHSVALLADGADGAAAAQLHLMPWADGGVLGSLSNYYSCLYGPVASQGTLDAVSPPRWREVARSIRRLPGSAVVRLQPLDAQADWLSRLEHALRASGYFTDRYFCFGNWYQPAVAGGFDAYWAARPSALRHSVERGRKRLDKCGPWRTEIVANDPERVELVLDAYQRVYAQSWKAPEPCPGFMPGLIRTAARQGWLRLGVLWLGDEPLAAQVWLVHGGKASIYKLAYARGHEKLSAGSVLTTALMRHALDVDGVEEIDYLSGDDAYKADWMAARRERVGLVAFDLRRWRGLLGAARHAAGRLRTAGKTRQAGDGPS